MQLVEGLPNHLNQYKNEGFFISKVKRQNENENIINESAIKKVHQEVVQIIDEAMPRINEYIASLLPPPPSAGGGNRKKATRKKSSSKVVVKNVNFPHRPTGRCKESSSAS